MLNRLTESLEFHGQALSLRSERQRLIASNIANADTPGYLARDMDFGRLLQEATRRQPTVPGTAAGPGAAPGGSGRAGAGQLATTAAGHLGGLTGGRAAGHGSDKLLYSTAAQTNLDGNSVDMDRERASFADNAVKYEATLRFINGNVRTMLEAIKGQS